MKRYLSSKRNQISAGVPVLKPTRPRPRRDPGIVQSIASSVGLRGLRTVPCIETEFDETAWVYRYLYRTWTGCREETGRLDPGGVGYEWSLGLKISGDACGPMDGYVLVAMRLIIVDGFPHEGEPFVEPELLPHLETLGPAQCTSLDESVNATVSKAVLVTSFVESRVKCMVTRRMRL